MADANSEDEATPQDIRSRIAAFEQKPAVPQARAAAPSSSAATSSSGDSGKRVTVTSGKYDPLQAMSSPSGSVPSEPTIIRPAPGPRLPSQSGSSGVAASRSGTTTNKTRVQLPGLAQEKPQTPSSGLSQVRISGPISPTSPSGANHSEPSERSSEGYPSILSKPGSLKQSRPWPPPPSTASESPEVSEQVSNAHTGSTRQSQVAEASRSPSTSFSLPPPRLPSRNGSTTSANIPSLSPKTETLRFVGEPESILPNQVAGLPKSKPPALPAKKPGSANTNSQVTSPVPKTDEVGQMAGPPVLPPRKQRSTSSASSASATNAAGPAMRTFSTPSQGFLPPALASLPPRPRQPSASSSASSQTQVGAAPPIARSLPPPPSRTLPPNTQGPPTRSIAQPNGAMQQKSTSQTAQPKHLQRYESLWERLIATLGSASSSSTADPLTASATRLDGLVVKQVWSMSKLDNAVLSRIWSQCDSQRQGSLDKNAFCQGLALIDGELSRRRRSRTIRR